MRTITAKVGHAVRYKLGDGRWRPGKIASIVAGTTVTIKSSDGSTTGSTALWSPASPTSGWKPN